MSGWVQIPNEVARAGRGVLSVYDKGVYSVIASWVMQNTGEAHLSYQQIADQVPCERHQAIRCVKKLAELGLLNVTTGRFENIYQLTGTLDGGRCESPRRAVSVTSDSQTLVTQEHQQSDSQTPASDSGTPPVVTETALPLQDGDKTNNKTVYKTARRKAELPETFEDDMAQRHPYWSRSKLQALIADGLNYYAPQFERGRYKDLSLCVQGSLRRVAEREGRNPDEPKQPPTAQQPATSFEVGGTWARIRSANRAAQAVEPLPGEQLEPLPARHA